MFQPPTGAGNDPAPTLPLGGLMLMSGGDGVLEFAHQNTRVVPTYMRSTSVEPT